MKNMKDNAGAIVGILGGVAAIGYGAIKLLTGKGKTKEDPDELEESEVEFTETTENEDNDDAE